MSFADSISSVLEKLGDSVALFYDTGEVRDEATGELIQSGSTNTVTGFGYPGEYRNSEIDGETVKRGDVRLTLNKVDEVPKVGWTANVVGRDYRVMDVRRVRYKGSDVVYICQLRV